MRHDRVERDGQTVDQVELALHLGGDLSPEQEAHLRAVARRCPVHRALQGDVVIREA